MKPLNEKTLLFKILINFDRLLNLLTGGELGVCLSTRAYIQALNAPSRRRRYLWTKIRNAIDYCFWDNHCEGSYKWEVKLKLQWLQSNRIGY